MSDELGTSPRDLCPFGETLSPPFVILRDGMKLREIKCNQLGRGIVDLAIFLSDGDVIGARANGSSEDFRKIAIYNFHLH